jgi:hypothetical protein
MAGTDKARGSGLQRFAVAWKPGPVIISATRGLFEAIPELASEAQSLPAENFAGKVCDSALDQTTRILFYAIVATRCGRFPVQTAGEPDLIGQGTFCWTAGKRLNSKGFSSHRSKVGE